MIHEKSYTPAWVDAKLKEVGASSYDLAEKMVYAFTLLEQLSLKRLNFIFKGGTCLAMMTDHFHRFSRDIDILMPKEPANLREVFDAIVADSPFTRWEESLRQKDEFQVPKKHFKFYYREGKPMGMPEKPILLDIIFVNNTYPKTQRIKLGSSLLVIEEPHTEIETPTFESLAGDKLTAFACNTIGIPTGKNKELEIAKQLFDLAMLHGKIISTADVRTSFLQTATMCIEAYHKPYNPEHVYEDILGTAFTMAMNGKHNKPLFEEIKRGVSGLSDYLSRDIKFGYEAATIAAAKVAYLVACLMKRKEMEPIVWSKEMHGDYKNRQIEHQDYRLLNKELKKRNPEAWVYWLYAAAVISQES